MLRTRGRRSVPGGRTSCLRTSSATTSDESRVNVLSLGDRAVRDAHYGRDRWSLLANRSSPVARGGALMRRPSTSIAERLRGQSAKSWRISSSNLMARPNTLSRRMARSPMSPVVQSSESTNSSGSIVAAALLPHATMDGNIRFRDCLRTAPGSPLPVRRVELRRVDSGPSNWSLQRVTTAPGEDFEPVWHPDGTHLAISSEREDEEGPGLAWTSGPDFRLEFLLRSPASATGSSRLPGPQMVSGSHLPATEQAPQVTSKCFQGAGPVRQCRSQRTARLKTAAMFSPKGAYVAYMSDCPAARGCTCVVFQPRVPRCHLDEWRNRAGIEPRRG